MILTSELENTFLKRGFLKFKSGLDSELIKQWRDEALERIGYRRERKEEWSIDLLWMDHHRKALVSEIAPDAWTLLTEIVGGEEKIEKQTMGIESKHFTTINSFYWSDSFIINFQYGKEKPWQHPQSQGFNWHVDGSYFRHFLDSREQALLVIILWSNVETKHGGTFIAEDSPNLIAETLMENPQGIDPSEFDFQNIADQCKNFIEITGNAGDMFIIHPFMLHASSQNHSQIPRVISNPPIILKEPLNLDPDSVNHSLLEKATLNYIQGRNWVQPKPEKRSSYWWVID